MTTFGTAPPPLDSTTSPHIIYLRKCLSLAEKSPPRPTNFRVGAMLVSRRRTEEESAGASSSHRSSNTPHTDISDDRVLSTGYTMELAGNTHAEQCCLANYAAIHSVSDERVAEVLPSEPDRMLVMYVTMEPCGRRLSGNEPCVQRIIKTRRDDRRGVEKVYFGLKEPGTFIRESKGCQMLSAAGIHWEVVSGMERDILEVATAGHENQEIEIKAALGEETNLDDISEDERRRQEQVPRNPKKRMMESELR